MRMPEFVADRSLFRSSTSYRGSSAAVRARGVMPQQSIVARPPVVVPPITINCDWRHRGCEWGCDLGYWTCLNSGVRQSTCAHRYFVCSDACDVAWERCRGLYRDPDYDPYADHFAGVG